MARVGNGTVPTIVCLAVENGRWGSGVQRQEQEQERVQALAEGESICTTPTNAPSNVQRE